MLSVDTYIPIDGLNFMFFFFIFCNAIINIIYFCVTIKGEKKKKKKLNLKVKIVLNETHEICGRLMGAYFMSCYIVSSHALHWENKEHHKIAVDTRSIVCCSNFF